MTPADLIAFEADIAAAFNRAEIRSPVHLRSGGEEWLIDYFARNYDAARGDWVCGAWRMHYHALLCGVPPEKVRAAIMAGRSITLCFPEHRVVSSAIVGGILPIALGLALGIKRMRDAGDGPPSGGQPVALSQPVEANAGPRHPHARVHAFVGDMTAMTGAYHEVARYARGHDLPLHLVIEDNGLSVMTDTAAAWGTSPYLGHESRYRYVNEFPHAGAGVRVDF